MRERLQRLLGVDKDETGPVSILLTISFFSGVVEEREIANLPLLARNNPRKKLMVKSMENGPGSHPCLRPAIAVNVLSWVIIVG